MSKTTILRQAQKFPAQKFRIEFLRKRPDKDATKAKILGKSGGGHYFLRPRPRQIAISPRGVYAPGFVRSLLLLLAFFLVVQLVAIGTKPTICALCVSMGEIKREINQFQTIGKGRERMRHKTDKGNKRKVSNSNFLMVSFRAFSLFAFRWFCFRFSVVLFSVVLFSL